ncbi:hypothetical protein [Streptantibioticus silvisoli]|uniref:hypothetical protein n=1 Tax=Streptantibioticus silvisoli TaxID=2705255 RepID=UPI003556AF6C
MPTLIAGANINPGQYSETIDHYNVLATLEQLYGLSPVGNSADASPITDIWN